MEWSGYKFYAEGEANELLTHHPTYMSLASTPLGRQTEYSLFVNAILNEKDKRDSQFSEAPYLGSTKFGILLQKKEKINKKYLDISKQTSPARAGHPSSGAPVLFLIGPARIKSEYLTPLENGFFGRCW